MSLFFIKHKHEAETCPAKNPLMGKNLLMHINPSNAIKFGVEIKADAVLDGEHTFVLVVEADNGENVKEFMTPFSMAGSVEISPASTCEIVVEREGC